MNFVALIGELNFILPAESDSLRREFNPHQRTLGRRGVGVGTEFHGIDFCSVGFNCAGVERTNRASSPRNGCCLRGINNNWRNRFVVAGEVQIQCIALQNISSAVGVLLLEFHSLDEGSHVRCEVEFETSVAFHMNGRHLAFDLVRLAVGFVREQSSTFNG
jgi:hypothetical protein